MYPHSIPHPDLQVRVLEVLLADVQVGHCGVLEGESEPLPGLVGDLKVLTNVQGPYPLVAQHLAQVPQLSIEHALRR